MMVEWIRTAALIAALQQHYASRDVRFVYENDTYADTPQQLYRMQLLCRELQRKANATVSAIQSEQLGHATQRGADRQLAVLLAGPEAFKEYVAADLIRRSLHSTKWLIFVKPLADVSSLFGDLYVPFNSEVLIIHMDNEENTTTEVDMPIYISEVYKVDRKAQLTIEDFGYWSPTFGLTIFKGKSLYSRRNNLQGITITITTVENYPIVNLDNPYFPTKLTGGYFGYVWKVLQESLNFTSRFIVPPDGAWGVKKDGQWNGMIGQLVRGEAELGLAEFSMTKERLLDIDFADPLFFTSYSLVVRHSYVSDDVVHWLGFLKPFRPAVWYAIAATAFILPIILLAMLKIARGKCMKDSELEDAGDIYLDVFRTFCQQGRDTRSLFTPFRITYAWLYYAAVVILASYSAALVSFLAVQTNKSPFSGLQGLADDGTYTLGVTANSGELDMFQSATNELLKQVYSSHMEPTGKQPNSSEEGLERACTTFKYCFFMASVIAQALEEKVSCDLDVLHSSIWTSLSLGFRKNSPYIGIINHHLRLLRDSGVLKRLRKRAWPKRALKTPVEWTSVKLSGVLPILVMLAIACLIAFILLILERNIPFLLRGNQPFVKQYLMKFCMPKPLDFGKSNIIYVK